MFTLEALIIILSYLFGGIPTSYLVAKHKKNIDIRNYGSGNIGAANAITQIGKISGFSIGLFDSFIKGTCVILLCKLLGFSITTQILSGLFTIIGHCWSPYIKFTGGRGVATSVGVVIGFNLLPEIIILTLIMGILGGIIFKETSIWAALSIPILIMLNLLFNRPTDIIYLSLLIGLILIIKRLTANWEPIDPKQSIFKLILNRAIWDRDIKNKEKWINRLPK